MQCLLILYGERFELALIQGVVGTNGLKKPEFTGLKSFLPWDFCIDYICENWRHSNGPVYASYLDSLIATTFS